MRATLRVALLLLALGCSNSSERGSAGSSAMGDSEVIERIDMGEGLSIDVIEEGTGAVVEQGTHMDLHLEMFLESTDEKVESTYDSGMVQHHHMGVDPAIPGVRRSLAGLREGSRVRLHIPSHLGFGAQGLEDVVPPYSDLVMDLHVVKVYGPDEPH